MEEKEVSELTQLRGLRVPSSSTVYSRGRGMGRGGIRGSQQLEKQKVGTLRALVLAVCHGQGTLKGRGSGRNPTALDKANGS
jgi:hypothetical protein